MKRILVVSGCPMRGTSLGLTGLLLDDFQDFDKNIFEISLFDTSFWGKGHEASLFPVDRYYGMPKPWWKGIVKIIPGVRAFFAKKQTISFFEKLLSNEHYDCVLIFGIPYFADKLVRVSHKYSTKVILYPWGSDVLACSKRTNTHLYKAFQECDYVVGGIDSNTIIASQEKFHVPEKKIRTRKTYTKGVSMLMSVRGKFARKSMILQLGIPFAEYYIVCSYNGYEAHRHKTIIEAIAQNKDVLPNNYQLLFPITYGAKSLYQEELRALCHNNGLNAVFLTSFLTEKQVSFLHLVTDLFIEIQPTDAGNAFMIEALCAENKIVTGRWLHYRQFEKYGEPYYLIDKQEELGTMLNKIFTNQIPEVKVPQQLIETYITPDGYDKGDFWRNLFDSL